MLIIDTKWKRLKGAIDDPKRGISQADVYQMMAYSQVYGCRQVMLLYPHHDEVGADEGAIATHQIRGADGRELTVSSISLSDLASFEGRSRALVLGVLGKAGAPAIELA